MMRAIYTREGGWGGDSRRDEGTNSSSLIKYYGVHKRRLRIIFSPRFFKTTKYV